MNDNLLQNKLYEDYVSTFINQYEQTIVPNFSKDDQQRYHSACHDHAGKFLLAIPVIPPLAMSNEAFKIAIKTRLRIKLFDNPTMFCNCYRGTIIEDHGDHLFKCCKNTSNMLNRHHAIVRCLSKLATEAGIYNRVEPKRSIVQDPNKRPDIILYNSSIHRGSTVAIDVSITHPVANYLSNIPSAALDRRYKEKERKYSELCNSQKMEFEGFIFETYGKFSNSVDMFIKKCCQQISSNSGKNYSTLKHQWVTRISAILQSSNAYFVKCGYNRLTHNNINTDTDNLYIYDSLHYIK
jgi:hypothetical protein